MFQRWKVKKNQHLRGLIIVTKCILDLCWQSRFFSHERVRDVCGFSDLHEWLIFCRSSS